MQICVELAIIANGLQIVKVFNKGLMKGKIMKNKGKLLLAFCGMLLINSTTISAAGATDNVVATNYVMDKMTDMASENNKLSDGVRVILAKKDNKEEKSDKKTKIIKKKKKNNKKKNKVKNNKKKNNKRKNSNKKSSSKKGKDKKNKKDKMDKKKDIDIREEDVNKLPKTDEYKPELKEYEKDNRNNREGEIIPPGGGQTETLSKDYAVLCDYTDKKGNLRFKTGKNVVLPEKGYIGLKANGENTGKETEIDWSGSSLQNIKNGIKGNYNLTVIPKENIIIGGKDYGMVKFVVNIIVE